MRIEDLIKQLAIDKYGSLRAFCEKEHLEYQTINKSLTRSVLRSSFQNTMKLCRALELDPYALVKGEAVSTGKDDLTAMDRSVLEAYRAAGPRDRQIVGLVLDLSSAADDIRRMTLPLYDLSASAGTGNELNDESCEDIEIIYRSPLRRAEFCLSVSGDSMEPRFSDGDIVAVEKTNSLEPGEIGIFIFNGDAYMKVFDRDRLLSLNSKYEPITFGGGDTVSIMGRVLGKAEPADK